MDITLISSAFSSRATYNSTIQTLNHQMNKKTKQRLNRFNIANEETLREGLVKRRNPILIKERLQQKLAERENDKLINSKK